MPLRLFSRYFKAIHSDHKRIARGAAWVAAFVLVGKLAGAAKEMAIAYRYGVSETVDAYQLAVTLVTWLPTTLVSTLTIVLVPLLVRLRQQETGDRTLFLRELQGSALMMGGLLGLAAIVIAILVTPIFTTNLSGSTGNKVWSFVLGMAPVALFTLLIGIYSARLMARERQINTLLESLPAATLLVFILFWPASGDIGPLLWGTLLGFAVQTVWLGHLSQKADGETVKPLVSWRSSHWPEIYKVALIMAAGQFVMSFIGPLDQFFASQMGNGAIATLGYANRVIALLIGVGALAISRSVLPVLADLDAKGQTTRARVVAVKWALLALLSGFALSAAGWALAPWVIQLLFERGAFSAQDTLAVTDVFRYGLAQLPFYFAGLVLVQFLASQRKYGTIAALAASNLIVKLAFNWVLAARLGLAGIALATGLMYAWSAGCLYFSTMLNRPRS